MTDFKFRTSAPEFKLGINNMGIKSLPRDFTPYLKKAPIAQKQPEPNVFFTPIPDNRDLILERMKRELEFQLELTKNTLPQRN